VSIWSDEEIRILREVYPTEGIYGTMDALEEEGYTRGLKAVGAAARRYGVQVDSEAKRQHLAAGQVRRYQSERREPLDISPTRAITPDSVEIVHWFAERGFPPHGIAEEINRPVEAIRKALRMQPPAIDTDPYWPRRDDMILGRAIA